jgi:SSS family solute:Na+ symporter
MSFLDWFVLLATQIFIITYGFWKSKDGNKDIKGYLLGGSQMGWLTIGISVMATQASAITFLSIPGQAFYDGMGFIQIYFGLPIAMVILSISALPLYRKLGVFTAYEYLEKRFDLKTRTFAAFLFLLQRGLSTGGTIYAPALILTTVLGWDINWTIILTGSIVTAYTVFGGTKAVSYTQTQQTLVIWLGMFAAIFILYRNLPDISFADMLDLAGKMNKMQLINFSFDPAARYTIWSGVLGGIFLSLSYFGTDQSQVQRYLGGESLAQSRLGLLMNAAIKIPMQFFILLLGVFLFLFYQFSAKQPVFFNANEVKKIYASPYKADFQVIEKQFADTLQKKQAVMQQYVALKNAEQIDQKALNESVILLKSLTKSEQKLHKIAVELIDKNNKKSGSKDSDYVFISFIIGYLPIGLIGLLVSVMLSASMSSAASAFNALASTTIIDIYKRLVNTNATQTHYLNSSKIFTALWGFICMGFALFVSRLDNLIQAVNILGSLFYGTVLGIFLVAFYMKKIGGSAVFWAAVLTESLILGCFAFFNDQIAYLWYNLIGCLLVMAFAYLFETARKK